MKQQFILMAVLCLSLSSWAQNDTTATNNPANNNNSDTIRIGTMIIVRKGGGTSEGTTEHKYHRHHHYYKPSNISTDWFQIDLGFANFNDQTNYNSMGAQQFAPGSKSDWFDLRTGKSVDVNIWFFVQRLNLIKHVVNLKYGLGLELNNYRYVENIKYLKGQPTIEMDSINYTKNKLAADYLTIPIMLNFNFTPHQQEGFGLSVGASAGYLYSSRQKLISHETGKIKTHDDFDLRPWKLSWIAELKLGPVSVYGSYAMQGMFKDGLDQTPYTVGIRLGNWW
jgi:Outer membrane protein beta-barrel domain